MAIPKTLKEIDAEKAQGLINKHAAAGTGEWEGAPFCSDFVYESGGKYKLLRPPCWQGGKWETGAVSM